MGIKLVGEIGINHNGDINIVKKLIDIASLCKLDYVKFQKRDIDLCYTQEFLDSPRDSPWGKTQRDQKLGLEFGKDEYDEIDRYCKEKNIGWFASPWDINSVEFLNQYDNDFIKIASAMVHKPDIINSIKNCSRLVVVSTGLTKKSEFYNIYHELGHQIEYILACTSTYPSRDDEMNLNFITTLHHDFPNQYIGFSNHHPGIQYCLCAATLGAEMIEFHMTLDRSMYGSDQASSIEPTGIFKIGKHVRNIELALGNGEWQVTDGEMKIREKLLSC
jgi:N-acetylneuraminate synthase